MFPTLSYKDFIDTIHRVKEPKTDNNILKRGSKTYVKHKIEKFNNTFNFDPSKQHSAMTPDYKTELDTT